MASSRAWARSCSWTSGSGRRRRRRCATTVRAFPRLSAPLPHCRGGRGTLWTPSSDYGFLGLLGVAWTRRLVQALSAFETPRLLMFWTGLSMELWTPSPAPVLVCGTGNTSSSTVWYSLGFIESCQGIRRGDTVWQVRHFLPHFMMFSCAVASSIACTW